jgi:DeoR/GlpR family transcriptional regulator of sugar metabolism
MSVPWEVFGLKLEQIIASACRQKMLLALSKVKRIHVTGLVRIINSTYNQVKRNLEILEKEGVVKTTHYANMIMIELRFDNPKTTKLLEALRVLEAHVQVRKSSRTRFQTLKAFKQAGEMG